MSVVTTSASILAIRQLPPLEQVRVWERTHAATSMALAATLYHLLTNVKPPTRQSPGAVVKARGSLIPANEVARYGAVPRCLAKACRKSGMSAPPQRSTCAGSALLVAPAG